MRHQGLPAGDRIRWYRGGVRLVSATAEVILPLGFRGDARGADVAVTGGWTWSLQGIYLAGAGSLSRRCRPHGRWVNGGRGGGGFVSSQIGQTVAQQRAVQILVAQLEIPECGGRRGGFAAVSGGGDRLPLLLALLEDLRVADHLVGADHVLRLGVEGVVGHVVGRLQPDPLLTLGEKAVVTRFAFASLSYWKEKSYFTAPDATAATYILRGMPQYCPDHQNDSNRTQRCPAPRTACIL